MVEFEWDSIKSKSNQKKHGISFEEAKTVFDDDFAVQFYDEENSAQEDRFLMLGFSSKSNLLMICHCERSSGELVRIISARKATKRERKFYSGEM